MSSDQYGVVEKSQSSFFVLLTRLPVFSKIGRGATWALEGGVLSLFCPFWFSVPCPCASHWSNHVPLCSELLCDLERSLVCFLMVTFSSCFVFIFLPITVSVTSIFQGLTDGCPLSAVIASLSLRIHSFKIVSPSFYYGCRKEEKGWMYEFNLPLLTTLLHRIMKSKTTRQCSLWESPCRLLEPALNPSTSLGSAKRFLLQAFEFAALLAIPGAQPSLESLSSHCFPQSIHAWKIWVWLTRRPKA